MKIRKTQIYGFIGSVFALCAIALFAGCVATAMGMNVPYLSDFLHSLGM